jgi:myosin heavy subunit
LKSEQEEYNLESLEWTQLDYFTNAGVVSLIENGSFGIFSILEEVIFYLGWIITN